MTDETKEMGPDILNIDEAAALLGVSVKTFNKVLHSQDMPARKIGREWKFSRRALIDWVGSGKSREFYRDSTDDADDEPEAQATHSVNAQDARNHQARTRRTAGWHIELD